MKLWNKGYEVNQLIEHYTVGMDYILDLELVPYDCKASIAHANMLFKLGILTETEFQSTVSVLNEIIESSKQGTFVIDKSQEDCHTAIENTLIEKLGDVGKKIHTARSRNDQVLVAFRLFALDKLKQIGNQISTFQQTLSGFVSKNGEIQLPGFTHTRKAMPMDISMWANGLRDAMQDNLQQLKSLVQLLDQSPLGTGAGYGIPLELDREMTSNELGFSRVQENPVYTQNSRAKFDGAILSTLNFIMYDLNKYSSDLILFSLPDFGFFDLPETFLTGSSIMPQKKNPDILELIRANYHLLVSREMQAKTMGSNLISGYHRDFQLLKEPVMTAFQILHDSLCVFDLIFTNLGVNREHCQKAMTEDLYATQKVYDLVKKGTPFRDAYRIIAAQISGAQDDDT